MRLRPGRVVGVDLSLVSTGVAWWPDCARRIQTKPKDWTREDDRLAWIVEEVAGVVTADRVGYQGPQTLVVVEGLSYGQASGSAFTRAGLHYLVRARVLADRHRLLVVPPTTLKQFVTGKGNASKELMVSTMSKRVGRLLGSDDVADALGLLWLGLVLAGQADPATLTKVQRIVIEKLQTEENW